MVGVVDRQQRLVGYITSENLAELVMIQSSRGRQRTRHGCRRLMGAVICRAQPRRTCGQRAASGADGVTSSCTLKSPAASCHTRAGCQPASRASARESLDRILA